MTVPLIRKQGWRESCPDCARQFMLSLESVQPHYAVPTGETDNSGGEIVLLVYPCACDVEPRYICRRIAAGALNGLQRARWERFLGASPRVQERELDAAHEALSS